VFGLGFRQVGAFHDQAVFAATFSLHLLPLLRRARRARTAALGALWCG
jgi:hypothetical protein